MYEDSIKWLRSVVERNELIHGDPAQPALDRLIAAAQLHEKVLRENRKKKTFKMKMPYVVLLIMLGMFLAAYLIGAYWPVKK